MEEWLEKVDQDYLAHISLDCVVFGFHAGQLKILLLKMKHEDRRALPGGFVMKHETMEEAAIRTLPGLGVVRDAQKWVALAVPAYSLAGAGAVVTMRHRLPAVATAMICCVALLATLPDLVWGVGGKVSAVQYPTGWARAAHRVRSAGPTATGRRASPRRRRRARRTRHRSRR